MSFSSTGQSPLKINLVCLCSKDLWGRWTSGSELFCHSTVNSVWCDGTRVSGLSGLVPHVYCAFARGGSIKSVYGGITVTAFLCSLYLKLLRSLPPSPPLWSLAEDVPVVTAFFRSFCVIWKRVLFLAHSSLCLFLACSGARSNWFMRCLARCWPLIINLVSICVQAL